MAESACPPALDKGKKDKDEDQYLIHGLTVSCTDAAGNVSPAATVNVIVPHDHGKD